MHSRLADKLRSRAKRARIEGGLLLIAIVAVIVAFRYRRELFGADVPVRIACVIALVVLGWAFARDLGRALGPTLFKHMDPGTAGTVGFLIRLVTVGGALLLAMRYAGLRPGTLAAGGAIGAVIIGLAAQQTLGNLIAGMVLLSARPFQVGDVVRLQAGAVGGEIEGTVRSLGLLYTTLSRGADPILVPNNVVLSSAIVPLREPSSIDLRAELRPGVKPSEAQELLQRELSTPVRDEPHIGLEAIDGARVVVRVAATPVSDGDGPRLADEVLAAMGKVPRPSPYEPPWSPVVALQPIVTTAPEIPSRVTAPASRPRTRRSPPRVRSPPRSAPG
jgi:small-conductance mechanosensitive channel